MYLEIKNKPKIIPGYMNGMKQPGLLFEIEIAQSPTYKNYKLLERYLMGSEISEITYQSEISEITYQSEISLIQLFSKFIISIQGINHIFCSEHYFFDEIKKESHPQKSRLFKLTLPLANSKAMSLVIPWVLSLFNNLKFDSLETNGSILFSDEYKKLAIRLKAVRHPTQNHPLLIKAALDLDIPILSNNYEYLELGIGSSLMKFMSTITSKTSPIGIKLVADKLKTSRILSKLGMPAPVNFKVNNADECIIAAKKISYPVVIKPQDREQGRGVFANIIDEKTLIKSFNNAKNFSNNILIEKHCYGVGHRLTVFGDCVVKVTKKLPLGVVGDGKSTIAELISDINKKKVNPDEFFDNEAKELLIQQNLSIESILDLDKFIPLRRTNNYSRGGSVEVIPLNQVHPDNIDLAISASRLFGLDIAGIDLIIPEIKISWLESEAIICDINSQPQTDPDTIKYILRSLFKEQGRIPFHLIIVDDKKLTTYETKALNFAKKLKVNGVSSKNGIFINGKRISKSMPSCFDASRALLHYSELESCLSILSIKETILSGLPLDQFSSITIDASEITEENFSVLIKAIKPHTKSLVRI